MSGCEYLCVIFIKKKVIVMNIFMSIYIYGLNILNFWNCLYKVWIVLSGIFIVFMDWWTVCQTVSSNHDASIVMEKETETIMVSSWFGLWSGKLWLKLWCKWWELMLVFENLCFEKGNFNFWFHIKFLNYIWWKCFKNKGLWDDLLMRYVSVVVELWS